MRHLKNKGWCSAIPYFFNDIQGAKFAQSVSIIRVDVASKPSWGVMSQGFNVFSYGLNRTKRNSDSSAMIRGQEDATQGINFSNWLILFDAIIKSLSLTLTSQPNVQLEVR